MTILSHKYNIQLIFYRNGFSKQEKTKNTIIIISIAA